MSRKSISLIVITSFILIAIPLLSDTPPKTPPPATLEVASPCPDGWQLKGRVTKNAQGSPVFVCVPKKPTLNCGPGTAPKVLPCEVGCQPVIK